MHPWSPSHHILNRTATPRCPEDLRELRKDPLSVRRPKPHSMPSNLLMWPDGHQMAPGLVAVSQG